ncbi:MAG: sugar kinase [Bacteroidota bacterium]
MSIEQAILVRDKTRLERLIERFNTIGQAKFYIERSGGNFAIYEQEHRHFYTSWEKVFKQLSLRIPMKTLYREHVPRFLFSERQLVLALGQDGLVANTAKYIGNCPLIGINPNPESYDGVLLPYSSENFLQGVEQVLDGVHHCSQITMAEAKLNDGQRLLAFNDLFIGPSSHTSARYQLNYQGQSEFQSSSGILVSTGAGSTGWLSSVINMSQSVNKLFQPSPEHISASHIPWDIQMLIFVVREPFLSRSSSIELTAGRIYPEQPLQIESYMPHNGVIFSDGIESDFLHFRAGTRVEIGLAKERASLVLPA